MEDKGIDPASPVVDLFAPESLCCLVKSTRYIKMYLIFFKLAKEIKLSVLNLLVI